MSVLTSAECTMDYNETNRLHYSSGADRRVPQRHFGKQPTFQHARQPGRRGLLWGDVRRRGKEGDAERRAQPEYQQRRRRGGGIYRGERCREGRGEWREIQRGQEGLGNGDANQRRADAK
ncbi:hypothetical protein NDU88_010009 [Pleurodeles waltl]|uniref:Uncharacterized protein n=1 Tax=Pleurodeles waltl TaxID=8319 RepID=A0AAV7QXE0_PLEWA|nr:hypothetical protein NDU88_010009 [Pleurodeles waltl]